MTTAGLQEQPSADAKTKVFVSYSRKDMAFVDRLSAGLEAKALAPKVDRTEIYSFEDWWKRIQDLIAEADTIVFVLSPDSIASEVCRKEVDYALSLQKKFAPIVCRPIAAEADKIPAALAQLNFIFFDDSATFEPALAKLVEALSTDIGWVRKHTQFGLESRAWAEAGRPNGLLLRSPRLEEAERWIANRPPDAPPPSDETRSFLLESRHGATRRRNVLTGSLAAGLVVAVALAGLAFWQRGQAVAQRVIADTQRGIADAQKKVAVAQEGIAKAATKRAETELAAEQVARKEATAQRDRAEKLLTASTDTAQSLVGDLAVKFRAAKGIPLDVVEDILGKAKGLLGQLESFHENTTALQLGRIVADSEMALTLGQRGSTGGVENATRAYESAVKLVREQPQTDGVDYAHGRAAEVLGQLTERGDPQKGLRLYEEAADAFARCAAPPKGLDCLLRQVEATGRVGNVFFDHRQYKAALDVYRRSRDLAQNYRDRAPPGADVDLLVAQRYNHLGNVDFMLDDTDSARQDFTTVVSFLEPLQARPDPSSTSSLELATAYNGLAAVLERDATRTNDRAKVREAFGDIQKDVALLEGLVAADPANLFYWTNLATAYDNLSYASQVLGDRRAVALYNQKRDDASAHAKSAPASASARN